MQTVHAKSGWSTATAHRVFNLLLLALQPVFVFVLSSVSIAVAALHPVNGLAAFCVALFLHLGGTGADDAGRTAP